MNTKKPSTGWVGLIAALTCLLVVMVWLPLATQAQSDLPPRPPVNPTTPPDDDDAPLGAHIQLNVASIPSGSWTVVQWQDSNGDWQDVEGWRGTSDQASYRLWWVDQKDFGSGPFRWVVTDGPGGPVVASSAPFNLPSEANTTLSVSIVSGQ